VYIVYIYHIACKMLFSTLLFICSLLYGYSLTDTVRELDVSKYIGHWFQVYGAPFDFTFQGYGKCITADYGLLANGNISVVNSQLSLTNELQTISGYAYYENKFQPGKLTVHLEGTPKDAPYWVVKLSDVVDNQYQYSIITTPTGLAMWVLARDVELFYEIYDDEVREFLDTNNISYMPIKQSGCSEELMTNVQSQCQIASYLRNSGFPESAIGTMVCISKYESSYNCDATNKNTDGTTDYGLFQINSYYWCSGDPSSKYNECSATCSSLFNCQSNSNCAYKVWKQQGYNAWYGYKSHKTECDSYKVNC